MQTRKTRVISKLFTTIEVCGHNLHRRHVDTKKKHLLLPLLALATTDLWKAAYGQTVKEDPQDNPQESNK